MEGTSNRSRKARIYLTKEQRKDLEQIAHHGVSSAKRILHARVLLMADEEHPLGRYTDQEIGRALGVHEKTVSRIRRSFLRGGITLAVERKRRLIGPIAPKLDGKAEAVLVAVCCSPAPKGHARWTLSLLRDELVQRKLVATICKETVRKALKKTNCNLGG